VDRKLDRKRLGVLTAAGLGVATLCGGVAFAFSGGTDEQPTRDTLPVGQLVDVPVSSAPSSSVEPPAVVADPIQKDTAVNAPAQQPAPQTAQQPATADDPTTTPAPPATTMPTGENGAPLNPAPAPPPPPPAGNPNPTATTSP
jgi:hypothetical protein